MTADERLRMLRYVQGTDNVLSRYVRDELRRKCWRAASRARPRRWSKRALFKKFLAEEQGTPAGVPTWNADFDSKRRSYVLSEPVAMPQYAFGHSRRMGASGSWT